MVDRPIKSLWRDSLEIIALFPPGAPARVLQTNAVGDFVFLAGHVPPGAPDVLLLPVVGEIVDLSRGYRCESIVVRYCISVDGYE